MDVERLACCGKTLAGEPTFHGHSKCVCNQINNLYGLNVFLAAPFQFLAGRGLGAGRPLLRSYLVDPASSHMLVSKIKPCMSKYKQFIQ